MLGELEQKSYSRELGKEEKARRRSYEEIEGCEKNSVSRKLLAESCKKKVMRGICEETVVRRIL
jgi:hypothetical protein